MALFSNGNKTCKLIMCIESESLARSSCLKCIEKRMMAADLRNQLPLFSGRSIYFATFCHLSMFQPDNYVAIVLPVQNSHMVHTPPPSHLPDPFHWYHPFNTKYTQPHTHPPYPNTLTQLQPTPLSCHNHPQNTTHFSPGSFSPLPSPPFQSPVLSSVFPRSRPCM